MTYSGYAFSLPGAAAHVGAAVAVAGDVNGDGYSDLIVGAPSWTHTQTSEGQAMVFLGGPAGYAATPSWSFESGLSGAQAGYSVAPAGDVNGDGYDDVIVGAPFASTNGLTFNGRAYVFLGGPAGLATTPAWTFDGTLGGELLGWSVATAGDVNGDGYDDVIVGSPGFTGVGSPQGAGRPSALASPLQPMIAATFSYGRAQVFHGGPTGLSLTAAWRVLGPNLGGAFGFSVATANDVNADGFADVVVGAPYTSQVFLGSTVSNCGAVYVYPGSSIGLSTTASFTQAFFLSSGYLLGYSVAGVGDVDGDGYADLVAGAPGYTNTATGQGAIFMMRGSATGTMAADWNAEGPVANTAYAGAQFGFSVAAAGDVNGDGYADFVAGAPFYTFAVPGAVNVGYVAVYQGTPNTPHAALGFSTTGGRGWEFGYSVCAAGDEDGDGFGDVIAGSPTAASTAVGDGRFSLYRGNADMPQGAPGWSKNDGGSGARLSAPFGSPAGDLDGDGYSDFGYWRSVGTGVAFGPEIDFYRGGSGGLAASPGWILTATSVDPLATGIGDVRPLDDVNGDGYGDIRVMLSYASGPTKDFYVPGGPSGPVPAGAWNPGPGIELRRAGDVNGDGYGDIVVDGSANPVALYLGGPSGPRTLPVWTLPNPNLDMVVVGLGDENGDGYGDLLVSDPAFTQTFTNQGQVQIFLGGPGGPATSASATYLGSQASTAMYGGSAGDLNGDGLADFYLKEAIAIPSGGYGVVTVHYGSEALPPTVIQASTGGPTPYTIYFVYGDGDLNGDGFEDLVVLGAGPPFNCGTTGTRAFLLQGYLGSATGVTATPGYNLVIPPSPTCDPLHTVFYTLDYFDAVPMDLNGDGYADLTLTWDSVTLPPTSVDTVYTWVMYSNAGVTNAAGLDRAARQRRGSDSAPIGLLGLTEPFHHDQFRLAANGRSAAGRTRVRLQSDVKNWGAPFETNLGNLVSDGWNDTSAPGANGSFVALDAARTLPAPGPTDKWRMRLAAHSPYFPWTPWLSPIENGRNEYKLRTAAASLGVAAGGTPPTRLELAAPSPNPMRESARLSFAVPGRTTVDLSIFDLSGRRVATLASGTAAAGIHNVVWDGRDASGRDAAGGIYFARLVAGGQRLTRKLVRMR